MDICVFQQFQVGAGMNTRATITGMNQSTTYECTVHAVTSLDGPASNPVTVTTLSGVYVAMYMIVTLYNYKCLRIYYPKAPDCSAQAEQVP